MLKSLCTRIRSATCKTDLLAISR
nr:hypothetical protein [Pseudomonas moorei]